MGLPFASRLGGVVVGRRCLKDNMAAGCLSEKATTLKLAGRHYSSFTSFEVQGVELVDEEENLLLVGTEADQLVGRG